MRPDINMKKSSCLCSMLVKVVLNAGKNSTNKNDQNGWIHQVINITFAAFYQVWIIQIIWKSLLQAFVFYFYILRIKWIQIATVPNVTFSINLLQSNVTIDFISIHNKWKLWNPFWREPPENEAEHKSQHKVYKHHCLSFTIQFF